MDVEALYSRLWSESPSHPYDRERERRVIERRFAALRPELAASVSRARAENRRLRVLDFGCSDGLTAQELLSEHRDWVEYYGLDVYPLDATASRLSRDGFTVHVSHGRLDDCPADWTDFDLVLALSCLQYVPSAAETLRSLAARLTHGGILAAYAYDAAPLRRATDEFFRSHLALDQVTDPDGSIARLGPLAELFRALAQATAGRVVTVSEEIPELGIAAGPIPLQQFLIDHVFFAWAPPDATTIRIQWALAEMFLTGPQVYLTADDVQGMLEAAGTSVMGLHSAPGGHLAIARRD